MKIDKERYFTVRWNNLLTIGLGIPALIYIVAVLSSSIMSDKTAFFVLFAVGVFY